MSNHEEPPVVTALVDLAKRLGVRCIVQVGAEDGYEAFTIAQECGGQAIAIEADERCGPHDPSLAYHYAVIGATDGAAVFYPCSVGSGLSSTLKRQEAGQDIKDVEMKRLDTLCGEIGVIPDALIIDTEGTTLDVLEGAGDLLNGVRLIYAEVQTENMRPGVSMIADVDAWLAARGFTQHAGLPSYSASQQGNYTYVRVDK